LWRYQQQRHSPPAPLGRLCPARPDQKHQENVRLEQELDLTPFFSAKL
jgi:hypothetical protein